MKRRAAVAAAVAAAAAQESPLRPAPAAPALSTPRGAAAAQLLAGLRGGPLILPPAQPLGAGKPSLQGATWWQSAVRPELVQQRVAVPAATPAGGAAAAPAAAMRSVAGPPVLPLQAPAVLPLAPVLLPFAGAVPAPVAAPLQASVPQALPPPLPQVPLPQALPPPLEHALGQPAGLAVAASVGELLLLLKVGAGEEVVEVWLICTTGTVRCAPGQANNMA